MQSPKVRAFVDFLVERLNLDVDYMQEMCEDSLRCRQLTNAAASVDAATAASETVAEELKRVLPRRAARPRGTPVE